MAVFAAVEDDVSVPHGRQVARTRMNLGVQGLRGCEICQPYNSMCLYSTYFGPKWDSHIGTLSPKYILRYRYIEP